MFYKNRLKALMIFFTHTFTEFLLAHCIYHWYMHVYVHTLRMIRTLQGIQFSFEAICRRGEDIIEIQILYGFA